MKTLLITAILAFAPLAGATSFNPPDPTTDNTTPLACNVEFKEMTVKAWQRAKQGRGGEAGFRIDLIDGKLVFGPMQYEPMNSVSIKLSMYTIAVFHTHPNSQRGTPSPGHDFEFGSGDIPDYVMSREGLFVTNPFNSTFSAVPACS